MEILTEISATIRFYTPIESIIVGFKISRKLTKVSEFNTQRQLWRSWPLLDDQRWLWDWIFWGSPILGDLGMFILGILAESSGLWIFYPRNFSGMGFFCRMGYPTKKSPLVGEQGLKTTKHTLTDFRNLFGYLKTPRSSRPSSNFLWKLEQIWSEALIYSP